MTELDDELIPAVFEIIAELGKELLFHLETTAYDVASGASSVIATQDPIPLKCTPPAPFEISVAGQVARLSESLETYLPAQGLTFEPKVNQELSFDGRRRRILAVGPIYSGALIALYRLEVAA